MGRVTMSLKEDKMTVWHFQWAERRKTANKQKNKNKQTCWREEKGKKEWERERERERVDGDVRTKVNKKRKHNCKKI